MAIASWPLAVSYRPATDPWSGSPFRAPLSTDMDGGSPRNRTRPGDAVATFAWAQDLSPTEMAVLDPFFRITLNRGAARFYMPVCLYGSVYEVRLVQIAGGAPKYAGAGGGYVTVSMTLDVFPASLVPAMPVITAVEPYIIGTSTASALVEVDFGLIIRSTTATGSGTWAVPAPYLEDGTYPVRARQTVSGIAGPWCTPVDLVMPNNMMRSLRAKMGVTEPAGGVFDLINDAMMVKAPAAPSAQYLGPVSTGSTFTRGSSATRINASGVMETVGANVLRYDYDPITLAPLGYLSESASTNLTRNSVGVGGTGGTPGVLPTNWQASTSGSGLNRQVSYGTYRGMEGTYIRVYGTLAAADFYYVSFDTTVAATIGQTFTASSYLAHVAGTKTNVTAILQVISEVNSGGTWLVQSSPDRLSAVSSTVQRFDVTRTVNQPTAAGITMGYYLIYMNAGPIDWTFFFAMPQVEQKGRPTSVIRTTGTIASRSLDQLLYYLPASFITGKGTVMVKAAQRYAPIPSFEEYPGAVSMLGTGDNIIGIYRYHLTGCVYSGGRVDSTGVTFGFTSTSPAASEIWRAALRWTAATQTMAYNGSLMASTSNALRDYVRLTIGQMDSYFDGHIREVVFLPRDVSDAQLQGLGA